ncbi:putative delta-60 repeat protein [Pseudomonas sp. SJZ085]|uniref:hypothetical protein n=1 Tax=unclassified Pseudomonas TaxID=196821 RepID=UPI00119B5A36|nr:MULTISPECIES: hypothetical protein [unclassified Pseudomonas]TWC17030.1 putative delta-60 repeat protein [Pseudomonas sp. SJZ074]TWC35216.1 putative delta-60 repeat protein [Pseudomonas sp. SJZ085]
MNQIEESNGASTPYGDTGVDTDNSQTKNVASPRAGELDPEFNNGEIYILSGTDATDVAIGPGNKLYIVGGTALNDSSQYMITALNPDGTLDESFNNGSPVINSFIPGLTSLAEQVHVLPDGKILVLGKVIVPPNYVISRFALARYLPNGTLDLSFGVNGHSVPFHEDFDEISLNSYDSAADSPEPKYLRPGQTSLVVHGGRTYISGFATREGKGLTLLMCLDDSGNLVQDFGNKGGSIIEHPEQPPNLHHVNARNMLVTDRHIYLGGYIQLTQRNYMAWVRVHLNGQLDLSFGAGGFVFDLGANGSGAFHSIASRNNFTLVGVGIGRNAATRYTTHGMLASIDKEGKADPTFNYGEPILSVMNLSSRWQDCAVQSNGRIVTCGSSGKNTELLIVGRYQPDGTFDTSFGKNQGWTEFPMKDELLLSALTVQHDHAIVVVGRFIENRRIIPFVLRLKG